MPKTRTRVTTPARSMLTARALAASLVAVTPGCGAEPHAAPGSTGAASSSPGDESGHGHGHGDGSGHGHGHGHGDGSGHSHGDASDHGGPLVHRFESAEQWAKIFDDPARDAWQRPADVVAAMRITPGMTVVDLGAGTGYFVPHLARAAGPNGTVLALDLEPDMVRHLRERAAREKLSNVRAEVVPGGDPSLPAGKIDRILIVDTWHHIPGRAAYAAKLKTALTPGGTVAVVDFTMDSQRGPPKHHRITPDQVIEELRAGGLTAEVIEEPLPDQYIVIGRRAP